MKVHDTKHLHFKGDFDKTLKRGCPFWRDIGLAKLHPYYKKKLWDWQFKLPADEIWIRSGFQLFASLRGVYAPGENEFAKINPAYIKMTRKQQEEYQQYEYKRSAIKRVKRWISKAKTK